MLRAALVLCKQAGDIAGALDCYTRDTDATHQAQVFDYINSVIGDASSPGCEADGSVLPKTSPAPDQQVKLHILDKLSDLIMIDHEKVRGRCHRLAKLLGD